jgi:hypothetical protein
VVQGPQVARWSKQRRHLKDIISLFRLNSSDEIYTNQQWYKDLKSRWSNYYDDLEKHWLKMFFRLDENVNNKNW